MMWETNVMHALLYLQLQIVKIKKSVLLSLSVALLVLSTAVSAGQISKYNALLCYSASAA